MAPEILNDEPHTKEVDIWSVGILLFELIMGSNPFKGLNPKQLLY